MKLGNQNYWVRNKKIIESGGFSMETSLKYYVMRRSFSEMFDSFAGSIDLGGHRARPWMNDRRIHPFRILAPDQDV